VVPKAANKESQEGPQAVNGSWISLERVRREQMMKLLRTLSG